MSAPSLLTALRRPSDNAFLRSLHERAVEKRSTDGVLTVPQAFDELFSAIEMTDPERAMASTQQKSLRVKLDALLHLDTTYLSGSYRRRTLIRPVDDIDLLLVLDGSQYKDIIALDGVGATTALDLVKVALSNAYPKSEIKPWGRCIQIKFAGTGIGFDVVPAFRDDDGAFYIPDQDHGAWVRTDPKEVERLVTEANEKTDGWLIPLVKLLKSWKDANDAPIRGYHLEALAYHALQTAPANARAGIADLFAQLAIDVLCTTPDIWMHGEAPDTHMAYADRLKVSTMLQQAATDARRAQQLEDDDDVNGAHAIWRALFGKRYPESGESVKAALLGYTASVRAIQHGAYVSATSAGLVTPTASNSAVRSSTSHGGGGDLEPQMTDAGGFPGHEVHLEWQIERALAQFTGLTRVNPAVAAEDPALWPVREVDVSSVYAVLVGEQGAAFGVVRRILVTVPHDMPATEPRIYRLDRPVRRPTQPDGRPARARGRRHEWSDGAMCAYARRDRWDGLLVTALIYAADWLFRQEYYQRFGKWIGREIGPDGQLLINGLTIKPDVRRTRPAR